MPLHSRAALLLLLPLLAPAAASAKDLRERVAVGANVHLGDMPALSVRYGLPTPDPAINVQLEVLAGAWSDASGTSATGGGRVLYGLVAEDNMNLFLGAGAGVVASPTATVLRIQPVMGADFFLFGLENLGFTAEWGLDVDVGNASAIGTSAAIGGGVHYWF